MKLFEGKFWKIMERLAEIFIINVLWLAGCVPLITAGASTAAMLHVFFHMLSNRKEPLLKSFWSGFVSNFKPATAAWAIYLMVLVDAGLVLWTGRRMDTLSAWAENRAVLGLGLFAAVLFLFTIHYIFGVIAFFECTVQQSVVNALGLCFKHLGTTFLLLFISAVTVLAVYIAPFLALIAFGLAAALDCRLLAAVFERYVHASDQNASSGETESV